MSKKVNKVYFLRSLLGVDDISEEYLQLILVKEGPFENKKTPRLDGKWYYKIKYYAPSRKFTVMGNIDNFVGLIPDEKNNGEPVDDPSREFEIITQIEETKQKYLREFIYRIFFSKKVIDNG